MSGHNKWSQIKHKKAATDGERSRLFSKYSKLITMESRLANGNILSPSLAGAIERAKRDGMPKDNIERAIAKGTGSDDTALVSVLFEAFGPGGVAVLITAVTDNNNRTSQELKHIFTKHGLALGAPGSAAWAFNKTADGFDPITPIALDTEAATALQALLDAVMEQPDVQEIFTTEANITES